MHRSRLVLSAIVVLTFVPAALANDWPQWLGPERNNVSTETGLLKTWPQGGPPLKWKAKDLGEGYSAPAVVAGRIYLMGKFGNDENVLALDEKEGKPLWSVKIGKVGKNPDAYNYPGPRGTPTVVGDKLYALGSDGDLVCLELTKGETVWKKNLRSDFGGKPGSWVYSESPLVDGEVVIVTPGGKTATVVALGKDDGKLVWKSAPGGGDTAAYSSPIRIDTAGVKQYVVFLKTGLVGLTASDGKMLWRYDKPANKQGINIPTPIFHNNQIFGVSGYKAGGGMVKLAADKDKVSATPDWFSIKLASKVGGFVCVAIIFLAPWKGAVRFSALNLPPAKSHGRMPVWAVKLLCAPPRA
jgi:outer membrane protein assembly factor BamB